MFAHQFAADFAAKLAPVLGATLIAPVCSDDGPPTSFLMPEGFVVFVSRGYNGAAGRVELVATYPKELATFASPRVSNATWPRMTADTSRDINAIAREVGRKLTPGAVQLVTKFRGMAASYAEARSNSQAAVAELNARFPWLGAKLRDGDDETQAEFYVNRNDGMASGRVSASGVYVQHVSIPPHKVAEFFALFDA